MKQATQQSPIPFFTLREILNDSTPMPDDLIAPQVLPPGGLVIINRTFEDELAITPRGVNYLKNLYLSNNKLIDKR